MSLTITPLAGVREGNLRSNVLDVTLDSSYPTGGEPIDPAWFGFRKLLGLEIIGGNPASAGYSFRFDHVNAKLVAYRSAGFTPAGTNGTSSVTGNVSVGGGAAGEPLGITPDSNAGALTKNAATARTIPIATFLGAAPTAGAQTFTGTAVVAGAMVEVANAVNLSAIQLRVRGFGR
jgi:hypothetical protein